MKCPRCELELLSGNHYDDGKDSWICPNCKVADLERSLKESEQRECAYDPLDDACYRTGELNQKITDLQTKLERAEAVLRECKNKGVALAWSYFEPEKK